MSFKMSLNCNVCTCFSNDTTEIDGRLIKFFPFPNDKKLKERWETVCRSICTSVTNPNLFRLCELHFEQNNFTENMQLKLNAIPTIFVKRRRAENKDENESKNENISTIKDNIFTSTPLKINVGCQKSLSAVTPTFNDLLPSAIKSAKSSSQYRLIIHIDKLRDRPGPKSKKHLHSIKFKNRMKNSKNNQLNKSFQRNCNNFVQENLRISEQNKLIKSDQHRVNNLEEFNFKESNRSNLNESNHVNPNTPTQNIFQDLINSNVNIPRCKTGCQLDKTNWNSKPAFKCRTCHNIYIPQSNPESDDTCESNNVYNQCTTCKQTFSTSKMLYSHIKDHLKCDICSCSFKTEYAFKNHVKQHVSTNPKMPFQCHLCDSKFDCKVDIRSHVSIVHSTKLRKIKPQVSQQLLPSFHRCKTCNLTFKNKENLRNHVDSHKGKVLPRKQIKSVKFYCKICSMEFSSLTEINAHTKIHTEIMIKDQKCNICKQVFTNDYVLNKHLQEHVLQVHRCNLCPKAFIDESSLQTHLQKHK